MEVLGQGLVLMIAGMGIVYAFLTMLIVVTKVSMKGIGRFDSILLQDAPRKKAAPASAGPDDADVALAIAVAVRGM